MYIEPCSRSLSLVSHKFRVKAHLLVQMWPSLLIRVLSKVFLPCLTWIICLATPYPRRPDPTAEWCDCWSTAHRASSYQWHPSRDLFWSGHDCTCEEQSSRNNCKTWIVVIFFSFLLTFSSFTGWPALWLHSWHSLNRCRSGLQWLSWLCGRSVLAWSRILSWIILILDLWQLQL